MSKRSKINIIIFIASFIISTVIRDLIIKGKYIPETIQVIIGLAVWFALINMTIEIVKDIITIIKNIKKRRKNNEKEI